MEPTIKDYEEYVAEYDKQYSKILQSAGGDGVPFDIGPKLNKAAFSQAFKIADAERLADGEQVSSTVLSHEIARTQLFYESPKQADNHLAIFSDEARFNNLPPEIQALKDKITKEDLLYGSPAARQLIEFIKSEYQRYVSEDTGDKKGRGKRAGEKIAQTFFGS